MDHELEKAIDEVGRARVFAKAHSLGWSGGAPPKHVWWGIVHECRQDDALGRVPVSTANVATVSLAKLFGVA